MRRGDNAFGSVCVFVCLFVRALLFEPFDLTEELGQTSPQTNERYQMYYLPCFAGDKYLLYFQAHTDEDGGIIALDNIKMRCKHGECPHHSILIMSGLVPY